MEPGRIPKDMLYGELSEGSRPMRRPHLRFKDVCKRDMKTMDINTNTWEGVAEDRPLWRGTVREGVQRAEAVRHVQQTDRRAKRKARAVLVLAPTDFICCKCSKDCHSRVGLYSHSRQCKLLA